MYGVTLLMCRVNSVCSAVTLRMWKGELRMLSVTLLMGGLTLTMSGVNSVCSVVASMMCGVTLGV